MTTHTQPTEADDASGRAPRGRGFVSRVWRWSLDPRPGRLPVVFVANWVAAAPVAWFLAPRFHWSSWSWVSEFASVLTVTALYVGMAPCSYIAAQHNKHRKQRKPNGQNRGSSRSRSE